MSSEFFTTTSLPRLVLLATVGWFVLNFKSGKRRVSRKYPTPEEQTLRGQLRRIYKKEEANRRLNESRSSGATLDSHVISHVDSLNEPKPTESRSITQWLCPFDLENTDSETLIKYPTNPTKFLLNLSPFGPNNQIRGFRDTLALAYLLNRTVITPPFFKHASDPSYNWTDPGGFFFNRQHISQKLDVEKLSKLVNILPFSELSKVCPGGMDATLFARRNIDGGYNGGAFGQLHVYEKVSGLELVNGQSLSEFLSLPKISKRVIFPGRRLDTGMNGENSSIVGLADQTFLKMNEKDVFEQYGSAKDDTCLFWLGPFRNMLWDRVLRKDIKKPNVTTLEFVKNMILHTSRPKSVRKTATDFIKTMSKNSVENNSSFAALHWRYDNTDFGNHCDKSVKQDNKLACEYLKQEGGFNATKISQKVANWLAKHQHKVLFVASPPSSKQFISEMSESLEESGMRVYHENDVVKFIRDKFENCQKMVFFDQVHDFTSQVEQEICKNSGRFLWSDGSTWSSSISLERSILGTDGGDDSNLLLLE